MIDFNAISAEIHDALGGGKCFRKLRSPLWRGLVDQISTEGKIAPFPPGVNAPFRSRAWRFTRFLFANIRLHNTFFSGY